MSFVNVIKKQRESKYYIWKRFFHYVDKTKSILYPLFRYFALKRMIYDQKILILGSGPSLRELQVIPKSIRLFTCNRACCFLQDLNISHKIDCYFCRKECWEEFPFLEKCFLKANIDMFFTNSPNFFNKKLSFSKIYPWIKSDDTYYLRKLIDPVTIQQIHQNTGLDFTSTGYLLLQLALYFQAKEIYLLGFDIEVPEYYFGPDHKKTWPHHPIDTNFVKCIAKKHFNIFSLSKKSSITKYFPHKTF